MSESSPLVEQSLTSEDLENPEIGVIAVRCQGKLLNFLNKPIQLRTGDVLLLQT